MTIRSVVLLTLLITAGFLGNYYTVPLFFGADFLFGSIAVLLVLYFYGLGWGMIAAVLVHGYTYFLWGHPYGFLNFVSEALFVGLFLKRGHRNLLLLDGGFWLLLGMPMVLLEHSVVMHMGAISTIFIMLKQAINGIFNALLVSLAIHYLPLGKLFPRPQLATGFSLRESLFSLLVTLVLLPALLVTLVETRKEKENLEAKVVESLQSMSANLQVYLHSWFQQHVQVIQELAGLASISSMAPTAQLQHETEILKQAFPNFRTLHVENAAGRTIACSPKVDEKGQSTLGLDFSEISWFKEAKAKHYLVVSEVFQGRGGISSPILVFSVPSIRENHFLGTATGALDLRMVQKILEPYSWGKPAVITLTDSHRQVIASTAPERAPMQVWDLKRTGAIQPLNASRYYWSPNAPKLPTMTRWQQSFYVQEISLGPDLPWNLTIEVPVGPLQHTLYSIYVKNLTLMAILTGLALIFSLLLSRWLTRPLVQLSQVTADLPEKLSEAQSLNWPVSSALEINSLIANSKHVAHTLEENFHNLQVQSDELRQVNRELSREIQERQMAEENLRKSLSLQKATLESTNDGLLVVDRDGQISSYNKKFALMWKIPEAVLASHKDEEALAFVLQQLKTPEIFLAKVKELYGEPQAESYDVIEFRDGRIFERFSQPQRLGEEIVGRVWSFRDVTRQRQAEGALRDNEQFLADIFNSIQDGLCILDKHLNILRVNFATMEKFPHSGPIVGEKCYEVYHGRREPCQDCPVQETLRTGEPALKVVTAPAADGSTLFIEIHTFPQVNPTTGQVDRVIEYLRNITARKQMEESLRESEEKYRLVFEKAPLGIMHYDRTSTIIDCNEKFVEIIGAPREKFIDFDLMRQLQDDKMREAIAASLKGEVGYYEGDYLSVISGKLTPVRALFQPIFSPEGELLGGVTIFEDITERKKAEQERLRFDKMESLGTLSGGIAHDFNNILTAIIGNINMARLEQKEGVSRERLHEAERACLRAQTLARQLLTFARGGAPITELISVENLVIESTSFASRGSNVKCEFNFSDNLWAIDADPGQIGQVVQNLVINAIQSMPAGGTIVVRGENLFVKAGNELLLEEGKYVKISIQDQGIGIPEEYLPKIFDPYFSTKQTGSGLGLATTYSIIQNHHGHIGVESKLGEGTKFYFYLPATEQKIIEPPPDERQILKGQGKILVMDDDAMVRAMLRGMLQKLGYEAHCAENGEEAITLYKEALDNNQPFTAAIFDLTVAGGMGGKEAIRQLLEIDPHIKVIVSSGYSDDRIMANFKEYGFQGVISKPYRVMELSKILNEVITKH